MTSEHASKRRLAVVLLAALAAIAAIVVGLSRITIVQQPVRTQYIVRAQGGHSDGWMSDRDCYAAVKMDRQRVLQTFGWPHVPSSWDDMNDSSTLAYPIRGTGDNTRWCYIDGAEHTGVTLDLPATAP